MKQLHDLTVIAVWYSIEGIYTGNDSIHVLIVVNGTENVL